MSTVRNSLLRLIQFDTTLGIREPIVLPHDSYMEVLCDPAAHVTPEGRLFIFGHEIELGCNP